MDGVVAGAANPRDLTKIFTTPEYAAWRRCVNRRRATRLCMPRSPASLRGAKTSPVDEFDFEEDTAGASHTNYRANAAYAMAANVN
jgi:type VI secretion system protein ImpC